MTETTLAKLFEHNCWANRVMIEACAALPSEQRHATPHAGSPWSVHDALLHLVESQQGYLELLTLPPEARRRPTLSFDELRTSADASGAALLALARDDMARHGAAPVRTLDGYLVEPWVVMVQVINHATDHRRQIAGLLRTLGVTPPCVDGWGFGETTRALVPVAPET